MLLVVEVSVSLVQLLLLLLVKGVPMNYPALLLLPLLVVVLVLVPWLVKSQQSDLQP
jgi:hypothetical protein